MRGKLIRLFLMDGDPRGRIKCTLQNWTGMAYKIPRTMLDKAQSIECLRQTGVYFLFGSSNETGEPSVYIGQAGVRKNGQGILNRWMEHRRDDSKDWWTEAVAFTTSNDGFGATEISYLENRFRNMAFEADRYEVMNCNDPHLGNLTEEIECEMEEFVDYARLVIGTLGYRIFEPLIKPEPKPDEPKSLDDDEPMLYFNSKRAEARGKRTTEGFVVMAGSQISLKTLNSFPENTKKLRQKYAGDINDEGILQKNLLFSSPSAAVSYVGGSSLSGNSNWKTQEGIPLKDLNQQR